MAFLPSIPLATDQLSVSQGNILNNFTLLGAIAGNGNASSASIDTAGGAGRPSGFNWLYLQPQGATPPAGAAFTAGNIGLYSFTNATTGKNELYVNKTNQATVVQIPMTASSLSVVSGPANGASGWTYLPSGQLMKWGSITGAFPNGVWQSFSFPTGANIPAFNAVFVIQLQSVSTVYPAITQTFNYLTVASNFTVTTFNWIPRTNFGSVNQSQIFYYAIGY